MFINEIFMSHAGCIEEFLSKKVGKGWKQKLIEASQNLFKFSEIINDNQNVNIYEKRVPFERIIDKKIEEISDPTKCSIIDCLNEILNGLNARANYGWEKFGFKQQKSNFLIILYQISPNKIDMIINQKLLKNSYILIRYHFDVIR